MLVPESKINLIKIIIMSVALLGTRHFSKPFI